jgi:hypothetical protein
MAITGGFIEVRQNRVTILADAAERAEEIDTVRAEEARRRAQRRLEERASEEDLARAEASLARALARIKVAERRRRRRGGVPRVTGLSGFAWKETAPSHQQPRRYEANHRGGTAGGRRRRWGSKCHDGGDGRALVRKTAT